MKKITHIFAALILGCYFSNLHSQEVGIGTISPKSTLDIQASSPSSPSNKDGLLIPRIDAFPAIDPGANQDGMMVFLTTPTGSYKKGFHYWDNTPKVWIAYNDEWNDGNVPQYHSGFSDDLIYARQASTSGTNVVVLDSGHIGMGTNAPEESLELRLEGDNDIQISSASPPDAPQLVFYTTNGSFASPSFLVNNNDIGYITGKVWTGTTKSSDVANIEIMADGNHSAGNLPTKIQFNVTKSGESNLGGNYEMVIKNNGNVGIGVNTPTATLHLKAGTSSANSAPLKLTSGTNLSSAEAGAVEYNGTDLFFTPGTTRKVLMTGLTNTASLDFPIIPSRSMSELTITVTGASLGSSCSSAPNASIEGHLQWSCYVSAANTVTVRLTNVSTGAVNPVNKSWKVTVIQ